MDMFTEYIIKRKKEKTDYIANIAIIIGAIVLSIFIFAFGGINPTFSSIVTIIIIGIWYWSIKFIKSKNFEYEYILTNGELDVDKIIARKRRKRIISVHCRTFETLAPYEEKYFNNYKGIDLIDTAKSKNSDTAYFAVFSHRGVKTGLVFEVSQSMLKVFKRYLGNKIILREKDVF